MFTPRKTPTSRPRVQVPSISQVETQPETILAVCDSFWTDSEGAASVDLGGKRNMTLDNATPNSSDSSCLYKRKMPQS